MMQARVVLVLLGSLVLARGQTVPSIDSAVYLSFFREAVRHDLDHSVLKNDSQTLNGSATDLVPQSIQEAMGITDAEAKTLVDEGRACGIEVTALDESAGMLVFESRLEAVNDEKPSEAIADQLRKIEARRVAIIMNHVERLKAALDAARFKMVEDYIRSRQGDGVFFPSVKPNKKL